MKSYTDLGQSRKLAEILSFDSADMSWVSCDDGRQKYYQAENRKIILMYEKKHWIPCWSLVALFNVMPQINDWITPHGHKNDKLPQFEPKICKVWEHSIIPSYKVTYDNGLSTDIYDNPVDACVDMVLKLHELGLL